MKAKNKNGGNEMIMDGIIEIIYGMQEAIKEEVAELNQRLKEEEI